jgi:hypothetical protein
MYILNSNYATSELSAVSDSRDWPTPVSGCIVITSWVRTWMERVLEFERKRIAIPAAVLLLNLLLAKSTRG